MNFRLLPVIIFIFLGLSGCKKSQTDYFTDFESPLDNLPRYDSVDWVKDVKFSSIDPLEKIEKQNYLERFFQKFWLQSEASGEFLVAWKGQILFEGYTGYSDFEKKTPITSETPIHLASISKILTGLAILKLVEKEKVNLKDKVSKYLTGFPYTDVTIENLLNHRSGLPNYLHFTEDSLYWDKEKLLSNQDVLNILIYKTPPAQKPADQGFSYNNTNYVLLALIIEEVTELDYPTAMKKMVFEPLGMENTFVFEFEKDIDKVSKTYYYNKNEWPVNFQDKTYGDKNIYSTPRDLLKMDIAMYSDKFLPKYLKEKAWQGYSYETKGNKNYGLGIRMLEWEDGQKILYHTGWWHGNNTIYIRDYANQAVIISLTNKRNRTVTSNSLGLTGLFDDYPFNTHLLSK